MKRTKIPGTLYKAYDSRVLAIEALAATIKKRDSVELVLKAATEMRTAAEGLGKNVSAHRYDQFACLLDSLYHLLRWKNAIRSAETDADRYLRAAKVRCGDLESATSTDPGTDALSAVAGKIREISDLREIEPVAELLLGIPLPLPLFARPSDGIITQRTDEGHHKEPDTTVVLLTFRLNDNAFEDPQTVEPGVLLDLTVEARLSHWPEPATELIIEPLSVEPAQTYEMPRFRIIRPSGEPPYDLRSSGRLILQLPQHPLSRPLEFSYRVAFEPENEQARVMVEGQRRLRLQSFDPDRNPQSGYREVDRRLQEIRTEARRNPGVRDNELGDFLQILTTLGRIAGQALQDASFPDNWTEPAFQKKIKELIRGDPRIGSELEEHPHAAGGITDLSFHKIRIELKVVQDHLVDLESIETYLGQTSQYIAGSDSRFGVLCVLDCSPKVTPPGTVANDISLKKVSPPGRTENEIPILIGTVIVRGNLSKPSRVP